ncbi:hypothetical protein AA0Y32_15920 [Georgenia phoenicis]|uniref:hypothetical protein n=1 Tax=unclassified Georgenia TaxID=2626815 RepID=UPI0039AFA027
MPPTPQPSINPRHFLVMATVSGVVLATTVLLWVFEVVPFGVFIGVVAALAVGQTVGVVLLQRGASQRHRRASDLTAQGGASTIGPDSPAARYGYDPMREVDGGR